MAQLVARGVRDAEVVGSSPITLTIFASGVSAAVARTPGGREVASSILVPPTKYSFTEPRALFYDPSMQRTDLPRLLALLIAVLTTELTSALYISLVFNHVEDKK